jgi:phosphomannomutase
LDVRARGLPVNAIDGLRVSEKGGWWLLRASGTEPKLTARCEAPTCEAMELIAAGLAERLRKLGLDPAGLD